MSIEKRRISNAVTQSRFVELVDREFRFLEELHHFQFTTKSDGFVYYSLSPIKIFIGYDPSTFELSSVIEYHLDKGRHLSMPFEQFLREFANTEYSPPMATKATLQMHLRTLARLYQDSIGLLLSFDQNLVNELLEGQEKHRRDDQLVYMSNQLNEMADILWYQKKYPEFVNLVTPYREGLDTLNAQRLSYLMKMDHEKPSCAVSKSRHH